MTHSDSVLLLCLSPQFNLALISSPGGGGRRCGSRSTSPCDGAWAPGGLQVRLGHSGVVPASPRVGPGRLFWSSPELCLPESVQRLTVPLQLAAAVSEGCEHGAAGSSSPAVGGTFRAVNPSHASLPCGGPEQHKSLSHHRRGGGDITSSPVLIRAAVALF